MKLEKKPIFILIAAVLLLAFTLWAANTGRIVVDSDESVESITIKSGTSHNTPDSDLPLFGLVSSGSYTVTIQTSDYTYAETVSVPRFFFSKTITPTEGSRLTSTKLANHTLSLFVRNGDDVYSMDRNSDTRVLLQHAATNSYPYVENRETQLEQYFVPLASTDKHFIGITTYNLPDSGEEALAFAAFNPVNRNVEILQRKPITHIPGKAPTIVQSTNNQSFITVFPNDAMDFYETFDSDPVSLDYGATVSQINGLPMIAIADQHIATYEGIVRDEARLVEENPDQDEDDGETPNNYTVRVYEFDKPSEPAKTITKSAPYSVSNISLSPQATFATLKTSENSLSVIHTENQELTTFPIRVVDNDIVWLTNESLLFANSTNSALLALDVTEKTQHGVFHPNMMNISRIGYGAGDTIAVTTLYDQDPEIDSYNLYGRMLIELSTNTQGSNNNELDHLPFINESYSIDILRDQMYFNALAVDSSDILYSDEAIRQKEIERRSNDASMYLESNGINTQNLQISRQLLRRYTANDLAF